MMAAYPLKDRFGQSAGRRAAILSVALALAALLAACRSDAPRQSNPSLPAAAVKVIVEHDGIYAVPAAALRQAGLDLTALQPGALSLTRAGRPVAFQLVGRGKNQEVRFYGEAPGSDAYVGRSVYWLTPIASVGNASGGIAARDAAPASVAATTVVTATVRAEEQHQYDGMAAAAEDRWLWQTIFAPSEIQVPIQAPHAAEGEAVLRVRLVANSSAPVDPDHHLILALNGAPVADERWDGIWYACYHRYRAERYGALRREHADDQGPRRHRRARRFGGAGLGRADLSARIGAR